MKADRIHCVVVRVPSLAGSHRQRTGKSATAPVPVAAAQQASTLRASAMHDQELLPWADPYIQGLIAKLKREAHADRSAGVTVEFDDACFDFDMEIEELLADGYALAAAGCACAEMAVENGEDIPALVRLPR